MLSRKLLRQLRKLNLQPRRAILGDRNGVIDEPGRPGFVRVQYPASPENTDALAYPTTVRMNAIVPKKRNQKVLVGYDPDGEVAVIRSDFSGALAAGENPIVNNPADQEVYRYVDQRDITTLRSQALGPGAPMWVSVLGWPYVDGAGVYHEFIGESTNLTSYIPAAADEWCLVLVALKTDDTLEVTQSTDQNIIEPLDSTDIQECIDGLTTGSTPVHLYKLVNGMTNILDEHDYMDMRQLVNVGFPGSGSGSSPWQTTSNVANLVTSTDTVTVGSATALGKLAVDGDADEAQFVVQGNATQTSPLILAEKSDGTDVFAVSNDGHVTQAGYTDLVEASTPSTPASDHLRRWAADDQGFTVQKYIDAGGQIFYDGRDMWIVCRNVTGSTLTKGTWVSVNSASTGSPSVALADANLINTNSQSSLADGVVLDTATNNSYFRLMLFGILADIDTSGYTAGASMWLSATAGAMTNVQPAIGAGWSQRLGHILTSHATTGTMQVNIQPPFLARIFSGTVSIGVGNDANLDFYGTASQKGTLRFDTLTGTRVATFPDKSGGVLVGPDPTFSDFTNANHDHLDADDGGTLDAAAIASGTLDEARVPTIIGRYQFIATANASVTGTGAVSMIGSGIGTLTLPANRLIVGTTIVIKIKGIWSTDASPGNGTILAKLGSTTICTSAATALGANISNREFTLEVIMTCRSTGASGTVRGQGEVMLQNTVNTNVYYGLPSTADVTIDTTATQAIDVTWSNDNSGNTITCTNCLIEIWG